MKKLKIWNDFHNTETYIFPKDMQILEPISHYACYKIEVYQD